MSEQDRLVIERAAAAARVCADPAFAALEASGAPIVAASGEPLQVVYLNSAARAVFGDDQAASTRRLFESEEPGARRLCELVLAARHGAAPRLERLRFSFGPVAQTVTILCRNISSPGEPDLFVIAALGVRPAQSLDIGRACGENAETGESRTEAPALAPAPAKPPRPERFLWRTDAAGRIVEVTPTLANVVGSRHADIAGREFLEAARSLRLDPQGRLADALALRRSWSGVELSWPLEGDGSRVPVTLGALPVFDDDRQFAGFRGYGVLHLDRSFIDAPTETVERREAEAAQPTVAHAAAPANDDDASTAPDPDPTPEPAVADASTAKVVPLRPPNAPHRAETPSSGDRLTTAELTAFDEIARALTATSPKPAQGSARSLIEAVEAAASDAFASSAEIDDALARHASALLDHLPVGVLVARDAQTLFANRTLLDYLGYADLDALQAAGGLARVFFGRRPQDVAERAANGAVEVQAFDGETLDVEARLQTIDWDGGPATLVTLRRARQATSSVDAARLTSLQAELARSRREAEELRALLDAASEAIALVEPDGRLRNGNRALGELLGAPPQALTNASLASFFADADQGQAADYIRRGDDGGEGLRVSVRTRRGEFVPIQLVSTPIGALRDQRRCVALRDLRPRRRSDDELDAARREAERANAAKSDFLAKVSHEVRTPLNAIIGFAEVMMEERFGPIGNTRYKEYLKDIHTSGAHVLSLVNDLLDLSKIEAGKLELDVERIDANAVIAECVSIMQPQASRDRVVIRLSLWPRLPRVLADGRSLRQILLNLLSNAIKFNEPGGQVIVSSALTDAGSVVIRLKDTGIGMSESEIDTALEPFRQIDTTRKVSGTGLGLPVTKALIEANHASFSIKSRKNEGTLVEVAFPPPQVLAAE
jgi:PAS domain S-box-containing protein